MRLTMDIYACQNIIKGQQTNYMPMVDQEMCHAHVQHAYQIMKRVAQSSSQPTQNVVMRSMKIL